jgi:replicative DNA helicase
VNQNGARVPPHNLEIERALIGAMLVNPAMIDLGLAGCTPEDCYAPAHGHMLAAVTALRTRGEPVDAVTVCDELSRGGLLDASGGVVAVMDMLSTAGTTTNVGKYAAAVAEYAVLRQVIALGSEMTQDAFDGADASALLDRFRSALFGLEVRGKSGSRSAADLYPEYLDVLTARYDSPDSLAGISTGFPDLDAVTGGLAPGSLTILGARPSVGKSAMAVNIAANTAIRLARPAILFSLEMGQSDIMDRLLSSEGRVDLARLRSGSLIDTDWSKIGRTDQIASDFLFFEDGRARSVMEIMADCRRRKAQFGSLGLVIVDYLQLMAGNARSENQQVKVSGISQGLKLMARDLDCPVLALSSLSRTLEMRGDKRPTMSDLKDSGSIEADADAVLLLYRDEIYSPDSPDRGTAEVIVAKNRNGPTGTVKLAWLASITKFASMARI